MANFSTRSSQIEIMDDLDISGEVIPKTLKELHTINTLLGGNHVTISGIKKLINNDHLHSREIHIADMGCGGGDILRLVADWFKRQGIRVTLTGIDANPNIVDYARENSRGYENIKYLTGNVFEKDQSQAKYDIVLSTLFLHHFEDVESAQLLTNWKNQSRLGVVINDLHRHPLAYHSIKLLTRAFSKSYMVRNDGPISVLRAFKKDDFKRILREAGINEFSLEWNWAFRWQLLIYNTVASIE
ncbi:MAG: methyltransferase domain-containing protein [Saprospiraceae bacterium]|nr:methyltransferase domain-containing protein [Saprospiraceae bacterium]